MLQIPCPFCGPRDETEFLYRGDATAHRPNADSSPEDFYQYVYVRANPRGWHLEWWQHAGGCRQFIKVLRDTLSHDVHAAVPANQKIDFPPS